MSVSAVITAHNSQFLSKTITGLGNVLFQVAISYSLAKKTGRPFAAFFLNEFCKKLKHIYGFPHGEQFFQKILEIADVSPPADTSIRIQEPSGANRTYLEHIETQITNLPLSSPIILLGHFEAYPYFRDELNNLRNFFSPPDSIRTMIHSTYPEIQTENVVSIHFRSPPGHDSEHRIMDSDYYRRAILIMKERLENPIFFVFKDGDAGLDVSLFEGVRYRLVHNEYDFLDLWTLSFLKNHILSYSTFNMWGVFLAPRDSFVIANKRLGFRIFHDAGFLEI